MNNVFIKGISLKKSIVMDYELFEKNSKDIFGQKVEIDATIGGLIITDKNYNDIPTDEINKKLSEYFNVKVVSIHIDDDTNGMSVWITYED